MFLPHVAYTRHWKMHLIKGPSPQKTLRAVGSPLTVETSREEMPFRDGEVGKIGAKLWLKGSRQVARKWIRTLLTPSSGREGDGEAARWGELSAASGQEPGWETPARGQLQTWQMFQMKTRQDPNTLRKVASERAVVLSSVKTVKGLLEEQDVYFSVTMTCYKVKKTNIHLNCVTKYDLQFTPW